ncbi:MAG: SBBP repeat-containing protein, partial [Ignavibacteriae bacterium]|nr:SBBP repeat-containing protein [Ignavibacteriota bacterium]
MRNTIFTVLIFLLPTFSFAQWAKSIGGSSLDSGRRIVVDGSGNSYVAGSFPGTVDFDPGSGIYNLTSAGSDDAFFAKYDLDGSLVWAKSVGGSSSDYIYGIEIDGGGNIYICGTYRNTVDFDPSSGGTFNLTSVGSSDVFFAKYDMDGNFVWAKSIGGTLGDYANSLAVDVSGNIYITGYFWNTVDFDPNSGAQLLTSSGEEDIFIAKYGSNGNCIWANRFGSTFLDKGISVALDGNGNVLLTGTFRGTVDFDPSNSTNNLSSIIQLDDIFLAKYTSDGNFVWVGQIGSISDQKPIKIVVDAGGNSYLTGTFESTTDFDPSSGIYNLTSAYAGYDDIFIAKYAYDGSLIWAKGFGGTSSETVNSMAIDASGNSYVTGNFPWTADFDPSSETYNLTSAGITDIFIAKYAQNGSLVWAKRVGGTSYDSGLDIAVDGTQNIYITGYFNGTVDFDPDAGINNLISNGGYDIFFAKYLPDGSLSNSNVNAEVKIFLEGPFSGGSMTHTLDSSIPLVQPYSISPWNYNGGETTTLSFITTNNIVDWVYIELRTGTSAATVVSKRAALLRNDGVILDPDGTTAIDFSGVSSGNYFIAVFHRNHLPVISASAVSF